MTSLIRCLLVAASVAGVSPLTARAAETSAERAVNARVDRQLKLTLHRLATASRVGVLTARRLPPARS